MGGGAGGGVGSTGGGVGGGGVGSKTSVTAMEKETFEVDSPSDTRSVTGWLAGPWSSAGVQVKAPPVVTAAPLGPETMVHVKVLMGSSGSVAVALKP